MLDIKSIIKKAIYRHAPPVKSQDNSIKLYWYREVANIGDSLNHDLISHISGKKIEWTPCNAKNEYFMCIGSVIQLANKFTTIWGSGIISKNSRPLFEPRKIHSVRGPLTQARLEALGIECPMIYGDPALLLSRWIKPNNEKTHKIGIIPHYIDKKSKFFNEKICKEFKIIDIQTTNTEKFISDLTSCDTIISSSLHGIIIADAYGIPNRRATFSKNIIGGDFKFNDYYMSTKREVYPPLEIDEFWSIQKILNTKFHQSKHINTEPMMECCPFIE